MVPEEQQTPRRRRKRRPATGQEEIRRKSRSKSVPKSRTASDPKSVSAAKPKKKRKKQQDDEPSTHKVIGLVMLGIALFGWACAAAAYAHEKEGWRANEAERFAAENASDDLNETRLTRRGRMGGAMIKTAFVSLKDFIWNAFRQIPNAFAVISFNFQHRLWLIILFICLEAGAVGFGYLMEKV
ncbi:MAG: hypothetical protein KDA74_23810, partial [Planctomycetaceae bacterium]|nr:hypothetical protein [Planctomycetaceae bacterium]